MLAMSDVRDIVIDVLSILHGNWVTRTLLTNDYFVDSI